METAFEILDISSLMLYMDKNLLKIPSFSSVPTTIIVVSLSVGYILVRNLILNIGVYHLILPSYPLVLATLHANPGLKYGIFVSVELKC